MEKDMYSVDEVANLLDVHPRTIRRYIRDETLKATKVGGQWRVKRNDLEMLMDNENTSAEQTKEWMDDLKGFVDGKYCEIEGRLQVCTIIDYYVDSLEEVKAVSQTLLDQMNSNDPEMKGGRFQYMFISEDSKARFTLWGNPKFVSKMLGSITNVV